MGVTYHGNALEHRTLRQNIPSMESSFPITNRRFGKPNTKSTYVSVIESDDPLSTAKEFYNRISYGGERDKSGDGFLTVRMKDGSVVTYRETSKSGSPAIDINIRESNDKGLKIRGHKIHFIKKGDKK